MIKPHVKSIEKVLEWFEEKTNRNNVTIYAGWGKETGKVLHRHEGNGDKDTREVIEAHLYRFLESGGDFTVYVVEKPGGTNGDTIYLRLPSSSPTTPQAINGTEYKQHNYVTERELNLSVENTLLKAKLENIEERISGITAPQTSVWERLLDKSLEDQGSGKELIKGIAGFFNGLGIAAMSYGQQTAPPKKQQAATDAPPTPQKTQKRPATATDATPKDEKLNTIFNNIKEEFPDAEPQELLEKLTFLLKQSSPIEKAMLKKRLDSL